MKLSSKWKILARSLKFKIPFLLALIFSNGPLAFSQESNTISWELNSRINFLEPLAFGISKFHSKRFITGAYVGKSLGVYGWDGYQYGIQNKIYTLKKHNKEYKGNWFFNQSVSNNEIQYIDKAMSGSGEIVVSKYITANIGFGRSFLINRNFGVDFHLGVLIRYSYYADFGGDYSGNDPQKNAFYIPYPQLGIHFFYRFF